MSMEDWVQRRQLEEWQLGRSVLDCNRFMLENSLAADVVFRVGSGSDARDIAAHRYMLTSRSPVFCAMLCGTLPPSSQPDVIITTDVDPRAFQEMLKYLYYEECELDYEELGLLIMYCARKYMLVGLVNECAKRLKEQIDLTNVFVLYEQSWILGVASLVDACLSFICSNAQQLFHEQRHIVLSRLALQEIIRSDHLYLPETEVFAACVSWARAFCEDQGTDPGDVDNLRAALGDCLYQIRFPNMTPGQLESALDQCRILSSDEAKIVHRHHLKKTGNPQEPTSPSENGHCFPTHVRQINCTGPTIRCGRFRGRGGIWSYPTQGAVDAVEMQCDTDILLHGFCIYTVAGRAAKELGQLVNVEVRNACQVLASRAIELKSVSGDQEVEVHLNRPLLLTAGTTYSLVQHTQGPPSHRGCAGRMSFRCNQVGIQFRTSPLSVNPCNVTTVETGQIPGILFSLV